MAEHTWRLERAVLDLTPRGVADRGVRLPVIRDDLVLLAALEVARGGFPVQRVVFEINYAHIVVGRGEIVVEGRELSDRRTKIWLPDPPVKVDDLGLVLPPQFGIAREPVASPGLAHVGPIVNH